MKLYFPAGNSVVFNTGPRDRRYELENMPVGQEYKFACKALNSTGGETGDLTFSLGEWVYSTGDKCYNKKTGKIAFSANKTSDEFTVGSNTYTDNLFQKQSEVRLMITRASEAVTETTYYIESIALYPKVVDDGEQIITPAYMTSSNNIPTKIERQYIYFSYDDLQNATGEDDLKKIVKTAPDNETYVPQYTDGTKWRNISVKESNYFNNLQALAEAFEAWLVIDVQHNSDGKTGDKNVYFKENIGQKNYANFIYGVNLKDIQRTYESKELVTKLIVKPNSNQYAPDGFCDISKAPGNITGETAIYDFSYYFKTGLMSEVDYLDYAYGSGKYYDELKKYNQQLIEIGKALNGLSADLVTYQAELEAAEAMIESANSTIEELDYELKELSGSNASLEREDVKKVLVELRTAKSERDAAGQKKTTYDNLVTSTKNKIASLEGYRDGLVSTKKGLNQNFYQKYSRFIQEGTWIDEEYLDDNLYYFDAQSVLNESCYPQVQYSINVLELSQLAGYEHFSFHLADRTNVIDPEFFKIDKPFEVVITEKKENLDDPTKNTMKLQNFKNQFKDLFQKITATVQQAQYRTGSYEKAVALVEANKKMKYQFLADSLSAAGARLTAAGQQSVVMDERGLTITSVETPTDTIRMVGGAILISKQDENGELQWTTAMTADGISASIITSGIVNTGEIAIMNKNQPTFRWDAFGLNAFGFNYIEQENIQTIGDVNYNKFVRFDRFGIYGVNEVTGISGLSWKPQDLPDIDEYATFALTWEGLKVTGGTEDTSVVARIGKQGDNIINITKTVKGENDTITTTDIFKIGNDGSLYVNGNGTFTGDITGSTITGSAFTSADGTFSVNKDGRMAATGGSIANWTIGADALYTGNDDEPTLYLGTTGKTATIGNTERSDLVFKAGSNFGVTSEGAIYATKGKIGSLTIGDINNLPDEIETAQETANKAIPNDVQGSYSWSFDAVNGIKMWNGKPSDKNLVFKITDGALYMSGNGTFTGDITGSTITGSAFTSADGTFSVNKDGRMAATGGSIANWTIGADALYTGNDDEPTLYLGTTGKTATIGNTERSDLVFKAGSNFGVTSEGAIYATKGKIGSLTIGDINNLPDEIETAQETANKAIPNDVQGSYSWSFDAVNGIKMWNGKPSDKNLVFKITDGALYMSGNGTFTGDITGSTITGSTFEITRKEGVFLVRNFSTIVSDELDSSGYLTFRCGIPVQNYKTDQILTKDDIKVEWLLFPSYENVPGLMVDDLQVQLQENSAIVWITVSSTEVAWSGLYKIRISFKADVHLPKGETIVQISDNDFLIPDPTDPTQKTLISLYSCLADLYSKI